jgi:hypothetical protein
MIRESVKRFSEEIMPKKMLKRRRRFSTSTCGSPAQCARF